MEIDLLICCTVTADMQFPATANIICDKVGAKNAWGFDLNALAAAASLWPHHRGAVHRERQTQESGGGGRDKMSSIIDYTDRATCIIFGDGCGAVLLEPSTEGVGMMDSILAADGSGCQYLHQKAGGSMRPATEQTVEAKSISSTRKARPSSSSRLPTWPT
jgi:3-oxoacyl-[acyl-carrier-protein] synthase-3